MDIAKLIELGGLGAVAIALIIMQSKERKKYLEIIGNHINHNTEVLQELLDFLKNNNANNK